MGNHIVFFSGGVSSFVVAEYVKNKYKDENILLYFTDVNWEDEDLKRFIYEVSDKLKLPMLIHSRGLTPVQLMVLQKFMANSRVGTCSKELKMKVSSDFIKKGIKPEVEIWHNKQYLMSDEFLKEPTLYFGIGYMEAHREGPIRANWEPYRVEMPLIENIIDGNERLKAHDIRIPELYLKGFSHNNCKGRCVKAGQGHFKNLLLKDEKTFIELMEQEIIISDYIRYSKQTAQKKGLVKDHMFKDVWEFVSTGKKSAKIQHILTTHKYTKDFHFGVDSKDKPISKPYTFMKNMSLEELEKQPAQCDMFDIGGCGCFSDYSEVSFS